MTTLDQSFLLLTCLFTAVVDAIFPPSDTTMHFLPLITLMTYITIYTINV